MFNRFNQKKYGCYTIDTKRFLVIFMFFTFSLSFSQNTREDLAKIQKIYRENTSLSLSMEYKAYADNNMITPRETGVGIYKRDGKKLYVKQLHMEFLYNENIITIVDNNRKKITIKKAQKIKGSSANAFVDIDTLLSMYKEVNYFVPANTVNRKAYALTFEKGPYKSVDMEYNAITFLVEKLTMKYRNKVQENDEQHEAALVIEFKDVQLKPQYTKEDFSESKYVTKVKGDYVLTAPYANYKLVNRLQK